MTSERDSREPGGKRPAVDELASVQWIQEDLHGGQGDQRGEGSGGDGADAIVIQRQQSHCAQTSKGVIAHTADQVAPQHPVGEGWGCESTGITFSFPQQGHTMCMCASACVCVCVHTCL